MRKVRIFGRPLVVNGSPYTLLVWREQFGGDLFAHIGAMAKDPDSVSIEDYLRIVWAMCRTVSDDVSAYDEWLREFGSDGFSYEEGVDAVSVMDSAVAAELFRRRETGRFRSWWRRLRQRLGRWLGRV